MKLLSRREGREGDAFDAPCARIDDRPGDAALARRTRNALPLADDGPARPVAGAGRGSQSQSARLGAAGAGRGGGGVTAAVVCPDCVREGQPSLVDREAAENGRCAETRPRAPPAGQRAAKLEAETRGVAEAGFAAEEAVGARP